MRAAVLVLQRPPYHGDVMGRALGRMGYRVQFTPLPDPQPGDLLVTWNRHASREAPVLHHEKAGGTVLVVENGYFGRNFLGSQWYAMALGQHNGAGRWPAGDAARWDSFGIPLAPWKRDGREIVVLATRNMGSALCREPQGWAAQVAAWLRQDTGLPVRVRGHPGAQRDAPAVSPVDDLKDAWAAVTWGSSAGLKALTAGVPVFHGLPSWIGAGAAAQYRRAPLTRKFGGRRAAFARVATAMWSLGEIANGTAFRCLLESRSTS